MKFQKTKNHIKFIVLSFTLFALICFPTANANAGFFSDGLKNAIQIIKSIIAVREEIKNEQSPAPKSDIIAPRIDNKPNEPKSSFDSPITQPEKQGEYAPQPPTPWSDLSNIIDLIKKEHLRLKNEFVPQKFIDQQKIIKPDVLINELLNLDLTTTTEETSAFFNITLEEFKEWQMRQEIIQLLNKEIDWYNQKLKEGLKMTNRRKVDNLIALIKNHRKEFKKTNIEPARIAILINGADDALKIAQNRNIIIKNSISNIKNESDRQIAEKLYLASQDKIKLVSTRIQDLKNNRDLTLEIAEPIILEINSLIKSMYEDFQLISEMP